MFETVSPNPEYDGKLPYSQGLIVRGETRTLYVAGQVGVDASGQAATDFETQARQAWTNLLDVLAKAGMRVQDLIKVTAFLTNAGDYAAYTKLRGEFLAGHKPTSTLLVVAGLARPEWKFEVEAVAFAPI